MAETPENTESSSEPNGGLSGLHDLLEAIYGAGVSANSLIQDRVLAHFKDTYFEDDGKPKTIKLNGADVAVLSLINYRSLLIDELELTFKIKIAGLDQGTGDTIGKAVGLDIGSTEESGMATCRIKFKGGDPPEGIARIQNQTVLKIPETGG